MRTWIAVALVVGACGSDDAPSEDTFSIRGTVRGLGGELVLANGDEALTLDADGEFAFPTQVAAGTHYDVTVTAQPGGQFCSVVGGAGVAQADVEVDVQCFAAPRLDARPLPASAELVWPGGDADSYDIAYSTDAGCEIDAAASCADGGVSPGVVSPFTQRGLRDGAHYTFWLIGHHAGGHRTITTSGAMPNPLRTDGSVYAIAADGQGRRYIGGTFAHAGAMGSAGAPWRTDTVGTRPFPFIDGSINAVIDDGAGGWYVGGTFSHVGGVARANLAHIAADGSLGAWAPAPDLSVTALARAGGTLYVAGEFGMIAGQPRTQFAAFDVASEALGAWAPPETDGDVQALAVSDTTVYAVGYFHAVGATARGYGAAFDRASGALTPWNPALDDEAFAVVLDGATVYLAGAFQMVGTTTRHHVAAVDAAGAPTGWAPDVDDSVYDLAIDPAAGVAYLGGSFANVNSTAHIGAAAVSLQDGTVLGWHPVLGGGAFVHALALTADGVYLAGELRTADGHNMVRVGLQGEIDDWNGDDNFSVRVLAAAGNTVFAGGNSGDGYALARSNFVALEADGSIADVALDVNGTIDAIAARGDQVYLGGQFTQVDGQPRAHLAKLDRANAGAPLTDWNPGASDKVLALAADATTVYVGGHFNTIGGVSRPFLAAVDAATGGVTAWDPQGSYDVDALLLAGTTLYAGGNFIYLGGATRNYIAALDTTKTTANALPFDANANGVVNALALAGTTLYIGGAFQTVSNATRNRIAAVDATTGALTAWAPAVDGPVRALAATATTVYAGGTFTHVSWLDGAQVSTVARDHVAAIDAVTAHATTTHADTAGGGVDALALVGGTLAIGGEFYQVTTAAGTVASPGYFALPTP